MRSEIIKKRNFSIIFMALPLIELIALFIIFPINESEIYKFILYVLFFWMIPGHLIFSLSTQYEFTLSISAQMPIILGIFLDFILTFLSWTVGLDKFILFSMSILGLSLFSWFRKNDLNIVFIEHLTIQVCKTRIIESVIVVVVCMMPVIWIIGSDYSAGSIIRHLNHQTVGIQSLNSWPPLSLMAVDVPYTNNYLMHLLERSILDITGMNIYDFVIRIWPIFMTWLCFRTILFFGHRFLKVGNFISLLMAFCFVTVFGYSAISTNLYMNPSISAGYLTHSPLFSIPLLLSAIIASSQPLKQGGAFNILSIHFIISVTILGLIIFITSGVRAQSGPVLICGLLAMVMYYLIQKNWVKFWGACIMFGVAALAFFSAISFFLNFGDSVSGLSFLEFPLHPFGFLSSIQASLWIPTVAIGFNLPAWFYLGLTFIVVVAFQASFFAPFFWMSLCLTLKRGIFKASAPEFLLFAIAFAGVSGTFLTEALGGSQFVFMHYAKVCMICLAGIFLHKIVVKDLPTTKLVRASWVLATILLVVHLLDYAVAVWKVDKAYITRAMLPPERHSSEYLDEIRGVLELDSCKNPIVVQAESVIGEGSLVVPRGLGLTLYGNINFVRNIIRWNSSETPRYQAMFDAMQTFEAESLDGTLDGKTVAKLFDALKQDVTCLLVSVPAGTNSVEIEQARAYKGSIADLYIFE